MLYVAGENLLPILVALLIGFITGFLIWRFARRRTESAERVLTEDDPMRRPYVENRPSAAFPAHQALMLARSSSWGVQAKTGRPKVHSVMKAWQRTGSQGVERPSSTTL